MPTRRRACRAPSGAASGSRPTSPTGSGTSSGMPPSSTARPARSSGGRACGTRTPTTGILNLYYRLAHDRLGAGLGREISRAVVAWGVEHRPDALVTAMVDDGQRRVAAHGGVRGTRAGGHAADEGRAGRRADALLRGAERRVRAAGGGRRRAAGRRRRPLGARQRRRWLGRLPARRAARATWRPRSTGTSTTSRDAALAALRAPGPRRRLLGTRLLGALARASRTTTWPG